MTDVVRTVPRSYPWHSLAGLRQEWSSFFIDVWLISKSHSGVRVAVHTVSSLRHEEVQSTIVAPWSVVVVSEPVPGELSKNQCCRRWRPKKALIAALTLIRHAYQLC